jgi:HEAT repeat protein
MLRPCDTLQEEEEEEEEEDTVLEEENHGQLKLQSPHAIPALQNSLRDLRTRERSQNELQKTKLQRGEPSGAAAVFVFAKFGKCSPNFDLDFSWKK